MTLLPESLDVCIIGGGFAGMNVARLLAQQGIKCQIYTSGTGSSRFWAGTVDFLNKEGSNLEKEFNLFKNQLPAHPYYHLQFKEAARYLEEFFAAFPELDAFRENNRPRNELVLTTLGTQKPCIGAWGTIFRDFSVFEPHTLAILVDFREFNNSVMPLVAKGLADTFPGKFKVLHLSFTELLQIWDNASTPSGAPLKLNETLIAQQFDKHSTRCEKLVELIYAGIKDQIQPVSSLPITCILFPPILGIQKTTHILQELTSQLGITVGELVAFSPSLMSQRLYLKYNEKLNELGVLVQKGQTLVNLERSFEKDSMDWTCSFEDVSGSQTRVTAKYVILGTGSLFNLGCVAEREILRAKLEHYAIHLPNPLTASFELISGHGPPQDSRLFVCGSASYLIRGGMTDEEEIQYGTGLGLAITTSAKVAAAIISQEADIKHSLEKRNTGRIKGK